MISIAGIFPCRVGAQGSIDKLRSIGIPDERLVLLYPGAADEEVEDVGGSLERVQQEMTKHATELTTTRL